MCFTMKNQNRSAGLSVEKQYFFSTVILFIFIAILYTIQNTIGYETVSMILLLILFLLPLFHFSRGPIILQAVISALAWDYYFIPPHFTMHIARTEDVMMLFMFFVVAVTNSVLTSRLSVQKNEMFRKERRLNALYYLLKDLSSAANIDELLNKAVRQIQAVFGFESIIFFPEDINKLNRSPHQSSNFVPDEMEMLAAGASFKEKAESGRTTNVVNDAEALYFPLINKTGNIFCVLGVKIDDELKAGDEELKFLKNFIQEISPFLDKQLNYSSP